MRLVTVAILTTFFSVAPLLAQAPVTIVEYFFDTDPGIGNAANVTLTPSSQLDLNFSVDVSGLSEGWHTLFIRAKNDSGWSMMYSKPILKESPPEPIPNITQLEYFIGMDPGNGFANAITLSPADSLAINNLSIDVSGLASGRHTLYIRARDARGAWSNMAAQSFVKEYTLPLSPITAIVYYFVKGTTKTNDYVVNNFTASTMIDIQFDTNSEALTALNLQSGDVIYLYVHTVDSDGKKSMLYISPAITVQ